MPDKKGNLYLFEAIELRNEYDRHIRLLEYFFKKDLVEEDVYSSHYENPNRNQELADDFNLNEMKQLLKKLQTKRLKLNQAIQVANINYQIHFNGENISIAEALDIRKSVLSDLSADSNNAIGSAYKKIIYKEKRDIIKTPQQSFNDSYSQFKKNLKIIRDLIIQIHKYNHEEIVNFKEE